MRMNMSMGVSERGRLLDAYEHVYGRAGAQ